MQKYIDMIEDKVKQLEEEIVKQQGILARLGNDTKLTSDAISAIQGAIQAYNGMKAVMKDAKNDTVADVATVATDAANS